MSEDDVKRLLAEATPGPWDSHPIHDRDVMIFGGDNDGYVATVTVDQVGPRHMWEWMVPERKANARLIAAAPTIAAAYIEQAAAIEALTAERDRLRRALRKHCMAEYARIWKCHNCGNEWGQGVRENHALGCLAALKEG